MTIGNGVTSIGKGAFDHCDTLSNATIGYGVTSIGEYAFRNCTELTNVVFNGTIEQWNAISKGSKWNENAGFKTVQCLDGIV